MASEYNEKLYRIMYDMWVHSKPYKIEPGFRITCPKPPEIDLSHKFQDLYNWDVFASGKWVARVPKETNSLQISESRIKYEDLRLSIKG